MIMNHLNSLILGVILCTSPIMGLCQEQDEARKVLKVLFYHEKIFKILFSTIRAIKIHRSPYPTENLPF
jgi:hypothetical protein